MIEERKQGPIHLTMEEPLVVARRGILQTGVHNPKEKYCYVHVCPIKDKKQCMWAVY